MQNYLWFVKNDRKCIHTKRKYPFWPLLNNTCNYQLVYSYCIFKALKVPFKWSSGEWTKSTFALVSIQHFPTLSRIKCYSNNEIINKKSYVHKMDTSIDFEVVSLMINNRPIDSIRFDSTAAIESGKIADSMQVFKYTPNHIVPYHATYGRTSHILWILNCECRWWIALY